MAGLADSWDYFLKIHDRLGPDGLGTAVTGIAHLDGDAYQDNAAFWVGGFPTIGVGRPSKRWPAATLQVLGHEFAHGVDAYTAGFLAGRCEAAALDEGSADFFGTMVDAWVLNGRRETIGDDGADWRASLRSNEAGQEGDFVLLRDFTKPSMAGRGAPDAWQPGIGDLDPHEASGPLNRALNFLSVGASAKKDQAAYSPLLPGGMEGLGNDRTAAIWYRALTTYLGPASGYADAREAALLAAGDLYGHEAQEVEAVAKAFHAINVGPATVPDRPRAKVKATATLHKGVLTFTTESQATLESVLYYVDGICLAAANNAPFALSFDPSLRLSRGHHVQVAKAYASYGPAGASAGVPFTLDLPSEQPLSDPSFEGNGAGWFMANPRAGICRGTESDPARHGYRYAVLGPKGARYLAQRVAIPRGSAHVALSFHVRNLAHLLPSPSSGESTEKARTWKRGLDVSVVMPDGRTVAVGALSDLDPDKGWIQHEIDLADFAGYQATVVFKPLLEDGDPGMVGLDDVTLVVAPKKRVKVVPEHTHLSWWEGDTTPVQLRARAVGAVDPAVTWTALDGEVDAEGRYRPPGEPGDYLVVAHSRTFKKAFAIVDIKVKPLLTLEPAVATIEPGGQVALSLVAGPEARPVPHLSGGPDPGSCQLDPKHGRILYHAPRTPGRYQLEVDDAITGVGASCALTVQARTSP